MHVGKGASFKRHKKRQFKYSLIEDWFYKLWFTKPMNYYTDTKNKGAYLN